MIKSNLIKILIFVILPKQVFSQKCIDLPPVNDTLCTDCHPINWDVYYSSPDIVGGNGLWSTGSWVVDNVEGISAAGGKMGLFLSGTIPPASNGFFESWSTQLTGLTIGAIYQINVEWQQAKLTSGAGATEFYELGELRMVAINSGIAQNYSSNSGLNDSWQLANYTFTATAPNETFIIGIAKRQDGLGCIVVDPYIKCEYLSIEESILKSNFSVYPNPTINNLIIENHLLKKMENFQLFDVSGKSVTNYAMAELNNKTVLDVSDLSAGIYFLSIENDSNQFEKIKFIKQ